MDVKINQWTITISQEEIEELIRQKTGLEMPDVYIDNIVSTTDGIIFEFRR